MILDELMHFIPYSGDVYVHDTDGKIYKFDSREELPSELDGNRYVGHFEAEFIGEFTAIYTIKMLRDYWRIWDCTEIPLEEQFDTLDALCDRLREHGYSETIIEYIYADVHDWDESNVDGMSVEHVYAES